MFLAVVEEGSVTRAARKLHRVQSNVTTRVRQLEEELGVDLFIREGKRLRLSHAGHALVRYARDMLDMERSAREAVLDRTPRGLFRLGAMESTAAVRLPGPLTEFHRRFPHVKLQLSTGNPRQLSAALLQGEIDAALFAEPVAEADFDKTAAFEEKLVLVTAKDHPVITARNEPPSTILVFENGCPNRRLLERWYEHLGHMPTRTIEMASYHAMLGCVVVGMGVALLPESVLRTFPAHKQLRRHEFPGETRVLRTALVWPKGHATPNVEALADLLSSPARSRTARRLTATPER